jgi:Arc/MetJ family transcription regulator
MRMSIEIIERLLRSAMRCVGTRSKKVAVEAALKLLVRLKRQEGIRRWRGKIQFDGDLEQLRTTRLE